MAELEKKLRLSWTAQDMVWASKHTKKQMAGPIIYKENSLLSGHSCWLLSQKKGSYQQFWTQMD